MTCGKPCDLAVAYRVQQISCLPPRRQRYGQLAEKFDVDAVAVTSSKARSLERRLPAA